MWILNFIPDSILHLAVMTLLFSGIGLYVLGMFIAFVPPAIPYKEPIRFLATVLMVIGVYFYGSYDNEMSWRDKVKTLQAEIDKKDAASATATTEIITKYVDRIKVVKEKGDVIIKEVPKYISEKSDAGCVIPKSFVVLHDSSSRNEVPDSTGGIDESASTTKLSTVTETVVGNYTIYHQTAEQLKALQEWVKTQEKIYNDH